MERSPRPLLRRRRIASLQFDDGSSCSCSPRCGEGGGGGESGGGGGSGEGEGCCVDVADGRRALCHSATMTATGGRQPQQLDTQDQPEGLEGLEGQAARRPRCPVARPGLASRGGGAQLRLVVSNLANYPVRLLLLDHAGEEQPFKTLLVDQARSCCRTVRHPPRTPPATHLAACIAARISAGISARIPSPPRDPRPLPHTACRVRGPLHARLASAHIRRAAAARGGRGDSTRRGERRCGLRVRERLRVVRAQVTRRPTSGEWRLCHDILR